MHQNWGKNNVPPVMFRTPERYVYDCITMTTTSDFCLAAVAKGDQVLKNQNQNFVFVSNVYQGSMTRDK